MTTRLLKSSENINGLPIGFQEVEYLESTGTQYIDTGVKATNKTKAIAKSVGMTWVFGGRTGLSYGDAFGVCMGQNAAYLQFGNQSITYSKTNIKNDIVLLENSQDGCYVNGVKQATYNTQTFTGTHNIYLFNLNDNDSLNDGLIGKIWFSKIYEDGVLVRDFIPALNPAGRPCMYDLVGKKAYYNLGTGEFTYGRKIIPVEYLESTGTQYIDTGYIPTNTTGQYAKMQYTTVNNGVTFGGMVSGNGVVGPYYAASSGSYWWIRWGTNEPKVESSSPTTTDTYEMYLNFNNDRVAKVNNIVISNSLGNISGNYPSLTLFRRNFSAGYAYLSGKIYSYKITEGTNLVRDFIPCIDENNTPYMFDKVTHTCYLNAGTGTFNYGKKLYSSKVRLYKDSGANKLPIGFKRVEYLESTGTQFILTGFTPTVNTDFEFELSSTKTSTNWAMGCPTWVGVHYKGADGQIGVTNSSTSDFQQYVNYARDNTRITMKLQGNTVYANGISLGTITRRAGTLDFALFGYRDTNRGATLLFTGSIYKCKIWDNNILVCNFIPALDTTNTPCMYDKVSGELFYNKGTGEFTYGDVIPNKVRLPQSTEIRFPAGYTEVEYLESDSTAYIDTGVSGANDNFKIEMGFSYSKFTAYGYFFSNYESESANVTRFCLNGTDTNYGLAYINTKSQNGAIYTSNFSKNNFHTFILTKTSVSIDGNTTTNNNPPVGTANTKNIILFNRGSGSYTEKRDIGMRCYYFRIYDNDKLIRYFIPALDPNGKPCMWDVVTKQPFYNQGTGEFSYGRQIIPVEYLESTGTQYIDTGYKPNTNTRTVGRVHFNSFVGSNADYVFGVFSSPNNYGLNVGSARQYFNVPWGSSSGVQLNGLIPQLNTNYEFDISKTGYLINGQSYGAISTESVNSTRNMYLFWSNGTSASGMNGRIYYCKIWDNDTLVRDLVPAIDSNNVGFVFDRVTHTIFDNKGTGSFTYGSTVPNIIRN